jgi:hypothetical protein
MIIYHIALTFSLLILSSCNTTNPLADDQPLLVKEAILQELYSGVRGGGKNINYTFSIEIPPNQTVFFDSVWIANKRLAIRYDSKDLIDPKEVSKPQILLLRAFEHIKGPAENISEVLTTPSQASITSIPPVAYEGAALIRYFLNGKVKYLTIAGFDVKPPIYGQ